LWTVESPSPVPLPAGLVVKKVSMPEPMFPRSCRRRCHQRSPPHIRVPADTRGAPDAISFRPAAMTPMTRGVAPVPSPRGRDGQALFFIISSATFRGTGS
jgi:hypothetical protein